jgi:hypothetical protein
MPADQARDRGQVDDRATALLEQRKAMLAAEKRAVEIDGENLAPGGEVGFFDVAERGQSRGIDQSIKPAVGAADVGNDAEPIGLGGDIERVIDVFLA